MVWISAMGQAFFSLSITGSGMIVYGAYLSKKEDIVNSAKNTAIFDTLAAMVAALVMIPAVFAYKMDPAAGPGLLFVTLPKILQGMVGGQIFRRHFIYGSHFWRYHLASKYVRGGRRVADA